MTTVEHITDTVGRDVLASHLGVGKTAISNAVTAGRFPARWYSVVRKLAADHGLDCPDDFFAFVRESEASK